MLRGAHCVHRFLWLLLPALAGCGPGTMTVAEDLGGAKGDAGVVRSDGALPDLSTSSAIDLPLHRDLSSVTDLSNGSDLSTVVDLSTASDLSTAVDSAVSPDLANPVDLTIPTVDLLSPVPDMSAPDLLVAAPDLASTMNPSDLAIAVIPVDAALPVDLAVPAPDLTPPPPDLETRFTLSVIPSGVSGALGRVSSGDGQIECGAACSGRYMAGDTVTLTETPTAGFYFESWGGACTGTAGTCVLHISGTTTVSAVFTPANYVFASSMTYTLSDLSALGGGATDADRVLNAAADICQIAGAALDPEGTFVPFLSGPAVGGSTTTRDAAANIPSTARGFIRSDSTVGNPRPFMDVFAMQAIPFYPPEPDETGVIGAGTDLIWTNTSNSDGTYSTFSNCADDSVFDESAQGLLGTRAGTVLYWPAYTQTFCDTPGRILCFQTDYSAVIPAPVAPSNGRYLFAADHYDPSSGLAGADAICAAGAQGHLPGTYVALLGTSTQPAISRITQTGVPLIRVDGALLAASDMDLSSTSFRALTSPLLVDGSAPGQVQVWTGATSPAATSAADGSESCNDWTSNQPTDHAWVGQPGNALTAFKNIRYGCDTQIGFYCIQQ